MVDTSPIPVGYKVPLFNLTVDPSQAGTPTSLKYALLVGHKIAAGPASLAIPLAVGSQQQADAAFGIGSMLSRMFARFRQLNTSQVIYCLPVAEPAGGAAATGTITVSSPPTAAGTLYVYVAGQRVPVGATASDTPTTFAAKIAAAINAARSLPVTASADTGVVTLSARWKGITGNDIAVQDSYLGANGGETLPVGLVLAYSGAQLSGGTGVPDFTAAIAALGDEAYEYVALPFTDTGAFNAWSTEFGFSDSGRWGWQRQTYGHVFAARRDTYAGQMTWGPNNNYGVISTMDVEVASPSPVWEWAAAYTARAAGSLSADAARPLQTLSLDGLLPAPRQSRRLKSERNAIAQVGIAIQSTGPANIPQIDREQTTYQRNSYGNSDNAYELVTTLATLAELFRRMRSRITNKFPRHKLANDGTAFGPGQPIVTPKIIKAEIVAQYRSDEYDGLVENGDAFKANLIVERSTQDTNAVSVVYPPDIINGLRQFNVLAQFRLQYAPTDLAA